MPAPAYEVVDRFEKELAAWCGSKYAVAVESCTAAIFLSLMYTKRGGEVLAPITIPRYTYPSVPCSIIHAGAQVKFEDFNWTGMYRLGNTRIWDSALTLRENMYRPGSLMCLSFHAKKLLPIGRGGMVLTDDYEAYKWLRKARFDGRDEVPLGDDELTMLGWNMYLSPELAARGLMLFDVYRNHALITELDSTKQNYPDLSRFKVYQGG
jgi:dTDP-4-amino-4,6-dideoxygalactose transaminase